MPDQLTGSGPEHGRIGVFISSTFRDMQAERDHLVTVVFPELRERLDRLRVELIDVDLRWGIPKTGVDGEKANSWDYCKKWIDRTEPFFVSILGQRYGYRPPTRKILEEDDKEAYAGLSITEMEIRYAMLNVDLYRRGFFYFRGTKVPDDASRVVRRRFVDLDDQDHLRSLKRDIRESGRPVRTYDCKWTGGGFDKLDEFGRMVLEDLWSGVLRDRRFVSEDVWLEILGHEPDQDPIYTDHSKPISRALWEQIIEHVKVTPANPLDAEAQQMTAFATSRLRWFHGRKKELEQLREFVERDLKPEESKLCVVRAVPGQGKSALLAKLTEQLVSSPHVLVSHFVGATDRSATAYSLLERLVQELDRNGVPHPEEEGPKQDLESVRKALSARLEGYEGQPRVVLVVDGLNQLTDGHDLYWLPHRLGGGVRIISSCIDNPASEPGSPEDRMIRAFTVRRPEPRWEDLPPLTADDVNEIVTQYLQEYCKELDAEQVDAICQMEQCRNPLYLLVMLHELRTLGGDDMHRKVPGIIAQLPSRYPDPVRLFNWVLERLEVFGAKAVRLWFSYLLLGRLGMSSRELKDLLSRELGDEAGKTALRIERSIRRYLQRRGDQLDFFHKAMYEAVERRLPIRSRSARQAEIAAYFVTRWPMGDRHAISELPYHQTEGRLWPVVASTLADLAFIDRKCRAGMIVGLEADYAHAQGKWPSRSDGSSGAKRHAQAYRELESYRLFVEAQAHRIGRHTSALLPVALGELTDSPVRAAALERLAQSDGPANPWFRPLHPSSAPSPRALVRVIQADSRVPSVALSGDGMCAVSAHNDGTLRWWDLARGVCLATLEGHSESVEAVDLRGDGRRALSGDRDGNVHYWDLCARNCLARLEGHSAVVWAVSLSTDGARALSGSDDYTLRYWDLSEMVCLRTLEGHAGGVTSVALSADGSRALSGSKDNTLRYWHLPTGACLDLLEGHTNPIWSVAISTDGTRGLSGSYDGTLRYWDLASGECLAVLGDPSDFSYDMLICSVVLMNATERAMSCGFDGAVRCWDLRSRKCIAVLEAHGARVEDVAINHNASHAISSDYAGRICWWDLGRIGPMSTRIGHTAPVYSVAISRDGKRALSGSVDRTVRYWDVVRGECVATLEGHKNDVNCVALSANGTRALSGGDDGTLRYWDLESGRCIAVLKEGEIVVRSVALAADGRHALAAVSGNRTRYELHGETYEALSYWDLEAGTLVATLKGHDDWPVSVSISPDGLRAVSVSRDFTLRHWDLRRGVCLAAIQTVDRMRSVALNKDGTRALTGGWKGIIRYWDLQTGECIGVLRNHDAGVLALDLACDDTWAVSVDSSVDLRLWDLASGECLTVFPLEYRAISVKISATSPFTVCAGDIHGDVFFFRIEGG